jgi:fluoride exporter
MLDMNTLAQCLAVGCGGFLGALARMAMGNLCGQFFPTTFPVGTLIINLTGSLFIGWFSVAATGRLPVAEITRLAIAVGFVGAYTTFSTFMLETAQLFGDGESIKATGNLLGSLVLGLIFVRFGMWMGGR